MSYKQKLFFFTLLLFYQVNNIFSDQLIKITNKTYPPLNDSSFNESFWGFRIDEYKDIVLRFFLSDDFNIKENRFEIWQFNTPPENPDKIIGYGTYLIKNGIIESFKVLECNHKVKSILTDQKIELYFTDQDIEENYYLLLKNSKLKLWGGGSYLVGKERMVDDVPVIIIEHNGFTIENAKIWTSPSLDDNTVKYIDDKNNELNYLPKNTLVFVHARTKYKYQVGEWYNYWYLIQLNHCSKPAVDLGRTKYVWIFGEFVRYEEDIDFRNSNKYYPKGYPYD